MMNLLNAIVLYCCSYVIWSIYYTSTINAEPITDIAAVEKKFLKHRAQLFRKLFHVGSKLSKKHVQVDPVCGTSGRNLSLLCITVAEKLYPFRRIAFGDLWQYRKPGTAPLSEDCMDGKVVLQTVKKKAVRVRLFKCPMSNYIFEFNFQMRDFYVTSSSSLKKVYVARDLHDTTPLVVGKPDDKVLFDGRVVPWDYRSESMRQLSLQIESTRINNSSANVDEELDYSRYLVSHEADKSSIEVTEKGVYYGRDKSILVHLYALIEEVKLKPMHVVHLPSHKLKKPFWHKLTGAIGRCIKPQVKE